MKLLLLTVVVIVLVTILNYQPAIGCGSKNGEVHCYGWCDFVGSLRRAFGSPTGNDVKQPINNSR